MSSKLDTAASAPTLPVVTVCVIAATALAVAMGIGRFAFTPLLPLMVRDGSVPLAAGAWLAASNYLGYLVGALTATRAGLSLSAMMRASLAGIVVSTAAMGALGGLPVWLALRFAAGVFSAWAMVAVSAWALQRLVPAGRSDLAGVVYAGVGLGIALVGLFCLVLASSGTSSRWLWMELGAMAALMVAPVTLVALATPTQSAIQHTDALPGRLRASQTALVLCYGTLGFGYILPATFLPAQAREIFDDPRLFGLAWPIFGIAAALSTLLIGKIAAGANRLSVWAISHAVMAAGVVLPSLWLNAVTIALAALAVGSTFVVSTMIGMQEARAAAPHNPAPLLAAMTAAFAAGQLAGPLVSGSIDLLAVGHRAALNYGLQLATLSLAASAIFLWRRSSRGAC
jgi:MFS family permease